jgi:hypothetical protein
LQGVEKQFSTPCFLLKLQETPIVGFFVDRHSHLLHAVNKAVGLGRLEPKSRYAELFCWVVLVIGGPDGYAVRRNGKCWPYFISPPRL